MAILAELDFMVRADLRSKALAADGGIHLVQFRVGGVPVGGAAEAFGEGEAGDPLSRWRLNIIETHD